MGLLEREDQLAALAAARDEAAAGRGSAVLVSGEPGIGKTALLTRFAGELDGGTRLSWGNCDDLAIPRPLGPFRDIAGFPSLERALVSDAPAHGVHAALLEDLAAGPAPTVLVIEDVHWADQATLDAIAVVGRRVRSLPVLMVLTFRSGELGPSHPLPAALDALRGSVSHYLQLAPLSRSAVTALAGEDADRVYAATGGNPFFVTELVAAEPGELPPSVANAVLGRASRLGDAARRLVELVAMVPTRVPALVLDVVMPGWPEAAEEPERRHILQVAPGHVSFRHELARTAVRSTVPVARRRLLHAELMRALEAVGADPSEVVHHAEEAGDLDAVAAYAPLAARRAAALESNREARSHYARALDFADRLPPAERARLHEEAAVAAYTVDELEEAFASLRRAMELYREVGDGAALGRCLRVLSRFHWYVGDGPAARSAAEEAIGVLEPLGDTVELAGAYSGLSQLAMLAGDDGAAVSWGERAVELARRLGADAVTAHALVNMGSVRTQQDPDDHELILEAHELADAAGERHEATRALVNLSFAAIAWVRSEKAWTYIGRALEYAEEHQVETLLLYARVMTAWLHAKRGEWDEAEGIVRGAGGGDSVPSLLADTVLAELAVRRGDDDAAERLASLADRAERTGELQRSWPVLQLEAERHLTSGGPAPLARFAAARDLMSRTPGWSEANVAAWGRVAGIDMGLASVAHEPFAAMIAGEWRRAAAAFGAAGWEYDRALMLTLTDDEDALVGALETARRLGAGPLEARAARRLTELGHRVPARARTETLANPAGLTGRQLEVADLLAQGLTNKEIAVRLGLSVRTVEHHVEAVLAKLGAGSRRAAARRYAELTADPLTRGPG